MLNLKSFHDAPLSVEYSITGIGSVNVTPLSVSFVVIVELSALEVKQSQLVAPLLEPIVELLPPLPSQPETTKRIQRARMVR